MKYCKILLIFSMVTLYTTGNFGQNPENSFKYSKITLSNGEIINGKNVIVYDENISFLQYNSTSGEKVNVSYKFSDLQNIQVTNKTHAVPGLLVGTGVGLIAMVIAEKQIEKPRNENPPNVIPWWADGYSSSNGELTYDMAFAPRLYIVGGCAVVGGIVGLSVKKGWETVFPKSSSRINSFDLNFTLGYSNGYQPGLSFKHKF